MKKQKSSKIKHLVSQNFFLLVRFQFVFSIRFQFRYARLISFHDSKGKASIQTFATLTSNNDVEIETPLLVKI
jgi:hypothetical protein